ncbi:MAG: moeZ 1 [Gammaproteobacteria bacterium]|jgi:UPF0176 protein|nr:moeZ 1 [Gammaproteobacteria bacterium]
MEKLNIAGYKFIALHDLSQLRIDWLEVCERLHLKGTIILSPEGINVALVGQVPDIIAFKAMIAGHELFSDISFRESYSNKSPFKRLKVKIKKEIITLRCPEIRPEIKRTPSISPDQFKQWLDEKRVLTVLDTRNNYEIEFGTFVGATRLNVDDFSELPTVVDQLPTDKPIVMFCTGGVRCEKAGLYLANKGFAEVYQLEGGILNYFSRVGAAHYSGNCFVFDERVALKPDLQPIC